MNSETTIRISTELARRISPPNQQARRAPAASRKPVTKGLWFHGPLAPAGGRGRLGGAVAGSVLGPGLRWRPASVRTLARTREPPRSALVVVAEPGDHVTQRGELRGDRVATTGQAVDLGLEGLQLALGVGVTAVAQRVGLLLGGADDLLGLAARPRLTSCSASWEACSRWAVAASVASRARFSAALARSSASVDESLGLRRRRRRGSRPPRGSGAPSPRRGRGGPPAPRVRRSARACSASRAVLVRSALVSCSAARRCCSASRLAEARWSSASAIERVRWASMSAMVRLRLSSSSRSWTTRMSSASASASALTAAASRWACWRICGGVRGGLLDHVGGLLLGQAQHLAGLAAEPGVGRVLVLVDLLCAATRPRTAEGLQPGLGLGEAGGEAGLLGGDRAQVLVHGGGVVAAAAHGRQRRGLRGGRVGGAAAAGRAAGAGWVPGSLPAGAAWGAACCWGVAARARRPWPAPGFSATFWAVFCPEACSPLGTRRGNHLGGLVPGVLGLVVKDGQALVAHASHPLSRCRSAVRRTPPVSPMAKAIPIATRATRRGAEKSHTRRHHSWCHRV